MCNRCHATSDLFFLLTMKQESENLILSLKFLSAILQLLIHDV